MAKQKGPFEDRFWAQVEKTDSCWLWKGYLNHAGYGAIHISKHSPTYVLAHRYAWQEQFGEIPEGLFVCHKCDVPHCVRPEHLFLGTNRDNRQDCKAKGRDSKPPYKKGEDHPWARFTEDDVRTIRAAVFSHPGDLSRLARAYGVLPCVINNIRKRRSWRHLP